MEGFKEALATFHHAARTTPAYRRVLSSRKIYAQKIKTLEDFQTLPILDKKSYINRSVLEDLFPQKKLPPMIYASSGSTGTLTYWLRGDSQEEMGGDIHEHIFQDIFNIKKRDSTLVVVCFAMGLWIAGTYTLASLREVARRGYNLVIATPGIEKEDVLQVLKNVAPHFQNLILAGYPPFLMDVITQAQKQSLRLKNNIKILTAGDKFSEKWRSDFTQSLNIHDIPHSFVSVYGCADAGILAHETPASITIRRRAQTEKTLYKALFGKEETTPGLFQYDPARVFFEEKEGELLFTKRTSAPLIRYNIHDRGNIVSLKEMKRLSGVPLGTYQWPFLVVKGRTDVAVTFYALNISPEHIQAGIEDKRAAPWLSGSFFAYTTTTHRNTRQKLYIKLELSSQAALSQQHAARIKESINSSLLKHNSEFRKLHAILGKRALPTILFSLPGNPKFKNRNQQGLMQITGKKAKIILA